MTPEEHHQEFVNAVVRLVSGRMDAGVMLLVASPRGLEILCSSPDYLFQFGILKTANATIEEKFRASSQAAIASGEREANEMMLQVELMDKPKGGVN